MHDWRVELALPDWVTDWTATLTPAPEPAARMGLVVDLARRNVRERTGGPFAAAVFESASGRLVAPGMNLVTSSHLSTAHAEIVALSLAQQRLGTYDLRAPGLPVLELVSSAEPCAMCLGAIPWSGIPRVVCGARDADIRAIGFDEGEKPAGGLEVLGRQRIEVMRDVGRSEAMAVLREYAEQGGPIYNPGD